MTRTELDHDIAQILARFDVVMHGSTTAWNPTGGDMKSRDFGRPPGSSVHPGQEWADRYNRAVTDTERAQVVHDAGKALERISHQPVVKLAAPEKPNVRDDRLSKLRDDGWTANEIALRERITPADVKRAWARTARPPDSESVRAVAARVGVSKSRVHRMFPGQFSKAA